MSLQPHVDRHALLAFEKQMHAYDVVGDRGWDVDLDAGTIVFWFKPKGADLYRAVYGDLHGADVTADKLPEK